jgi:hypothetical protein
MNWLSISSGRMIELAAAVLILGAGIWLYRRPKGSDGYGSQGAVILFVVAAIMGLHALGAMDYHPSQAEADYYRARAR